MGRARKGSLTVSSGDVLAVLLVVIPASVGLVTYALQERDRRAAALSQRRRELYESLIGNLFDLPAATDRVDRSDRITEIEKSWLFASDDVLEALYAYLDAYDELCRAALEGEVFDSEAVLDQVRREPATRQRMAELLARLFVEMRREVREDTEITDEWAKQHFQIYLWGILSGGDAPSATENDPART
jgi:hypothetical protein